MNKRSIQREAIMNTIADRKDHPTAEIIYHEIKKEIPSLSLGTVYRNLRLLEEQGKINAITVDGITRFDPNTNTHAHFVCKCCKNVIDMSISSKDIVNCINDEFEGKIIDVDTTFSGICHNCLTNKELKN